MSDSVTLDDIYALFQPYKSGDRIVRRAKLILAAASGESNSSISRRLELDRVQVRLWRERWKEESEKLFGAEEKQVTDKKLMVLIFEILSGAAAPPANPLKNQTGQ